MNYLQWDWQRHEIYCWPFPFLFLASYLSILSICDAHCTFPSIRETILGEIQKSTIHNLYYPNVLSRAQIKQELSANIMQYLNGWFSCTEKKTKQNKNLFNLCLCMSHLCKVSSFMIFWISECNSMVILHSKW